LKNLVSLELSRTGRVGLITCEKLELNKIVISIIVLGSISNLELVLKCKRAMTFCVSTELRKV